MSVVGVSKHFERRDHSQVTAIDDVTLDVDPGEFLVLLGPSGCGKTTLLRSIAGLERPQKGKILLDGRTVFSASDAIDVPPEHRKVAMIFQSYALWPHMTVAQNVRYPLEAQKLRKSEIDDRANAILEKLGIADLAGQYPAQISGGQQQRVALSRALVSNKRIVLFDEPLSNVDAKVREQLRIELLTMQRQLRFTAVYVTHDQVEAMALANRIAVMRAGKVEQLGSPSSVYLRPSSRYVADFIGAANNIVGKVKAHGNLLSVETKLGEIAAQEADSDIHVGSEVVAHWRPERCDLLPDEPTGPNRWKVTVKSVLFLGAYTEYYCESDNEAVVKSWAVGTPKWAEGDSPWAFVHPGSISVIAK